MLISSLPSHQQNLSLGINPVDNAEIAGARDSYHGKQRVSPFYHGSESCFQGLKQSDPMNQEREYRLISILRPRKSCLILLNCANLKFVSYTSNWLERIIDFRKCTMFLQKWILNPQDLLQNWSLETVPICIVWQYFPHDNIVGIHVCDECMKANELNACHELLSIWWLIEQVCSRTRECQAYQFVLSTSISRQSVNIPFDNSPTDSSSSFLKMVIIQAWT